MTPTQGSFQSPVDEIDVQYRPLDVIARWKLKVRDPKTGLFVPCRERKNKFTDAGLTNLAKLWVGQGTPTVNLVIDSYTGLLQNNPASVGAVSISLDKSVHKAGDTQLVVGAGLGTQETVTFTAVSGTGPYIYTLSTPLAHAHNQNEWVVRQVLQSDVMTDIKSEMQYDAVSAPNQRMVASGTGYSSGSGSYTMQFFLTGTQAIGNWVTLGLADSNAVGGGVLSNHLIFGFNHQSGNDVELDITLTLANA